MPHADRLIYYFKALPEGTLVTHDEIINLLWRGCSDGGPMMARGTINVHIYRANKKLGYRAIRCEQRGNANMGWRYATKPV